MRITSTISRMLLATGALTLCLMGGVNIASADEGTTEDESTTVAKQADAPEPSPTAPEFEGYDSGA